MRALPSKPGYVVISTQGHDKGQWYAVTKVLSEQYLLLCNGNNRTLKAPKKKQVKHLRVLPLMIPVSGLGESGGPIVDGDIRKALKAAKDAYITGTAYAQQCACNQKEECAFVQE
ncbi:MAG: hypothetical protein GX096_14125 [Clostridiales bacterium]|nr:hypothetical protein [Clostridiales bacterium]